MSRKSLIENAILLGLVQLIGMLLPFFALPYLAKVLGPHGLGEMAFALALAQVFVLISDYGFNLSAARFVARHREEPGKVWEIFVAVTLVRLALALAGVGVLLVLAVFWARVGDHLGLFLAAYLLVFGGVVFPQWLFQGLERLRWVSLVQVVARVLLFCLMFVWVHGPQDVLLATCLQALGPVLGGVLVLPYTWRQVRPGPVPSWALIQGHLQEGWRVFFSTVMVGLYTTCNSFFVGLLVSPADLAGFHVAEKIFKAVVALYGAVANAIYPHVSRLAVQDVQRFFAFNRRLLVVFELLAVLVAVALFWVGPWFVARFFGAGFDAATAVLHVFAWAPVLIVASNVLGIQTLLPLGMEAEFSRVILASAVFNLVVFLPATFFWGILGAAWANLGVELCVVALMLWALKRSNHSDSFFRIRKW